MGNYYTMCLYLEFLDSHEPNVTICGKSPKGGFSEKESIEGNIILLERKDGKRSVERSTLSNEASAALIGAGEGVGGV